MSNFVRSALALAALLLVSVGWSPAAFAAEYKVEVCTANAGGGDGIVTGVEGEPGPLFFRGCGVALPGGIRQGTPGGFVPADGGSFWSLVAPENTRIRTLELEQSFSHVTPSFLDWFFTTGTGVQLFHVRDDGRQEGRLPPTTRVTYTINSRSVTGFLHCFEGCPGDEFTITLRDLVANLEDNEPPSVFAPTLADAAVRGTTKVPYNASDLGSGVADASLIVDGVEQPLVHDGNGGRCQKPYRFVLPCRSAVASSLPLDTTRLSDGQHQVRVAVVDAAGQRTVSAPVTLSVHNAPTSTGRPAVSGQAKIGGELTVTSGGWDGAPTGFAYQWLRCPPGTTEGTTSGCTPIDGATSPRYAPTERDVNQRTAVRVTATNASGSGSAVSAPSDIVADAGAPVLTHVSLAKKRLRIGRTPNAASSKTLLRFSSSEAGRLTIAIDRIRPGKEPKHVATLAAKIKAGRVAVPLGVTIGAKRLTPGRYQVTIVVRDAEQHASVPVQKSFAVLAG